MSKRFSNKLKIIPYLAFAIKYQNVANSLIVKQFCIGVIKLPTRILNLVSSMTITEYDYWLLSCTPVHPQNGRLQYLTCTHINFVITVITLTAATYAIHFSDVPRFSQAALDLSSAARRLRCEPVDGKVKKNYTVQRDQPIRSIRA